MRRATGVSCCVRETHVERWARLADLSESGARVFTEVPPPVGTSLNVSFQLSEEGPKIEGMARVVWCSQGYGGRGGVMGIEFTKLSSVEVISQFVADEGK